MMMKAKWILPFALTAIVGCATVPLASPESDEAAQRFMPPEGKANLYVARSNSSYGGAVSFKVVVDEEVVGEIAPGTFFLVAIDPGKHSIAATSIQNSAKAIVDAEAGRNYFYEVTATSGVLGAQASLGLVLLEPMGKLMVRQAKLARTPEE